MNDFQVSNVPRTNISNFCSDQTPCRLMILMVVIQADCMRIIINYTQDLTDIGTHHGGGKLPASGTSQQALIISWHCFSLNISIFCWHFHWVRQVPILRCWNVAFSKHFSLHPGDPQGQATSKWTLKEWRMQGLLNVGSGSRTQFVSS